MTYEPGSRRHTQGMLHQKEFYLRCKNKGYDIKESTPYEDRAEHIDFHVNGMRVDVKGTKRVRGTIMPEYTWVEINGEYGRGWLYAEKVTHYAFRQPSGQFTLISKENLQSIVRGEYGFATHVTNNVNDVISDTRYYCYRRLPSGNLPTLKNERTILVDTKLIIEKSCACI